MACSRVYFMGLSTDGGRDIGLCIQGVTGLGSDDERLRDFDMMELIQENFSVFGLVGALLFMLC